MFTAALAAQAAPAAASARVTYSRSFKGSQPSFLQVEIAQDGQASYQAREQDSDPLTSLSFTASPATVAEVFRAADALRHFAGPKLESKDKVAFTGEKMLAFDDATQHASQLFTYTKLAPAVALIGLMEKISTTGIAAIRLQRAMKYQPLNLLDLMESAQTDWAQHQMAEPQLLQPTLEALVANPAAMSAAKDRAQKLLDAMAKAKNR